MNQYNYNNLLQRYDNLKKEYNQLRTAGFSTTALDSLRRELKEKEERINQMNRGTSVSFTESYNNPLQNIYNDLKSENYDLKNKLNLYQTHYKTQTTPYIMDNDLNNIRNSIIQNNKVEFSNAITQLKTNLDNVIQNNYNTIISMQDRQIEQWKQQERIRREKEKQQLNALISRYDQNLTMEEQENEKLKMRLKELEGYFV